MASNQPSTSSASRQEQMETDDNNDPKFRNDELRKISHMACFLYTSFYKRNCLDVENINVLNIDESNEISEVLYTLHTFMRNMANPIQENREKLNDEKQVIIGPEIKTIKNLALDYMKSEGFVQFDFKFSTPLVELLTSFELVYNEIRISCSKFTIRTNRAVKEMNITSLGLDNSDISKLKGVTFKPERRIGLLRQLGPLALMINLAVEKRYTDKLENALRESLNMFPMVDNIIECLKKIKTVSEGNALYKSVSRAVMLYGSCTHHKMHFPVLLFVKAMKLDESEALKIHFSNNDGFKFYNKFAFKVRWVKNSGGMAEDVAQVVFHSIFATALEDLSILSQITNNQNWKPRKELNKVFLKASENTPVQFTPIAYKYVSIMASENMGILQPQNCSNVEFDGKQERTTTEVLKSYLEGKNITAYYNEPIQLTYQINSFIGEGLKLLKNGKLTDIRTGTASWYRVEGDQLIEDDVILEANNVFFYT